MVKETRLYELIGAQPGASAAEMKKSYRKKAMKYHPDRNPEAGNKVPPGPLRAVSLVHPRHQPHHPAVSLACRGCWLAVRRRG